MSNLLEWMGAQTVIGPGSKSDEWFDEHWVWDPVMMEPAGKFLDWTKEQGVDNVDDYIKLSLVAYFAAPALLTELGLGEGVAVEAAAAGGELVAASGLTAAEIDATATAVGTALEGVTAGGVATAAGAGLEAVTAPGYISALSNIPVVGTIVDFAKSETGKNLLPTLIGSGTAVWAAGKTANAQLEAARQAGESTAAATDKALALQKEIFYQQREDLAPWREAGWQALTELDKRITAGPGEYVGSEYENFLTSEGVKTLDRSAASRGRLQSGAQQKAITRFGQDIAGAGRENFLREYYQGLAPLQSLAGVGLTSTEATARFGSAYGANAGNLLRAGGMDLARTQRDVGDIRSTGYIDLSNIVNQGIENYLTRRSAGT